MDYRTHVRQTRERHNAKLREVLEDPYLPDNKRYDVVADLTRKFSTEMNEARRDAEAAYRQELERLERQANPAPVRGRRDAAEMMERGELREDLERGWQRDKANVLEGYREAVRLGDAMAMEVHERYGAEYIKDPALRREFGDLMAPQVAARMTSQQRAAVDQLEQLRAEESQVMLGIVHQAELAAGDRRNAQGGRPVVSRDEVEARREMGLMAGTGGR